MSLLFFEKGYIFPLLDGFASFVLVTLDDGGESEGSPGIFKSFHSLESIRNILQNINAIILHSVKTIGKMYEEVL